MATLVATLAATPRIGAAQSSEFDTQLFLPTPAVGSTFTIDRPTVPRHLTFVAGLSANMATGLLVRSGDNAVDVVDWRGQADLLAAMGLFEWLELGAVVPLTVARVADDPFAIDPGYGTEFGFGDLRFTAKVPVLRGDFKLAVKGAVVLPTGDGQRFLGTHYWSMVPGAVFAWDHGGLTLAGEVGYWFRQRSVLGGFEYDDELLLSVGAAYALAPAISVIAEGRVRVGVGGRSLSANQVPVEFDGGFRWSPMARMTVDVGVGTGVGRGYGSPGVRGLVAARFATDRDTCDAGPEDFDGYQDGDFCADPDNDGDGVLDADDECPNNSEDHDGFLDGDGCPDTDNDADGVVDGDDQCPLESEDRDGYQDADGCPEPDNDGDGVPDGLDECPMEPEDLDRYQDEDGCPEPGPDRATVTVTDSRILISERIYFDYDTDTIRSVSMPLLDQVAEVVLRLSAGKGIRVEGYSDSEGDDQYNLDLSYRRARSVVEYLVGRGVPRPRTDYIGYGEQHPVAPNDSPEGRALNRRVEFTILEPGQWRRQSRRR